MKPGKRCFFGDLLQVDLFPKMLVDEQFGLNDPAIKVSFRVIVRHHSKVVISLRPPPAQRAYIL